MKTLKILFLALMVVFVSPQLFAKESGEKGGTADINIGIGELQESRTKPARKAASKNKKKEAAKSRGLLLPAVQNAH